MNNKRIMTAALLLAASVTAIRAQTIVDWDFDSLGKQSAPYNSPAPSTGTGTATVLGMNNDYNDGTGPSLPYADITSTPGASSGNSSFAWRIRGGSVSGGAGTPNGWSTNAPIATQGAEFATSTVGYNGNIKVSFDLFTTIQSEANVALLYTLDGSHWIDAALAYSGTNFATTLNNSLSANTLMGSYLQLQGTNGGWYNQISVNLGTAADNDANFAFEIVNASTSTDDINQAGGIYNNNSGNDRFDNVAVVNAVPEPGTLALAGFGSVASLWLVRRSRKI